MDIVYGFFASPRYWKAPDQLAQAYESLSASLPGEVKHHLVTGQEDLWNAARMAHALIQVMEEHQARAAPWPASIFSSRAPTSAWG